MKPKTNLKPISSSIPTFVRIINNIIIILIETGSDRLLTKPKKFWRLAEITESLLPKVILTFDHFRLTEMITEPNRQIEIPKK
jgi:hypothetical protein